MSKFPVVVAFDVDGETLWLARDKENVNKPVCLSLGQYGLNEGIPRILKLLKKYNIPATFFVPGMIAEKYPQTIRNINEEGHEIGNHGYSHTHPHKFTSKEVEKEEYVKTNKIIEELTGKVPNGYRSPAWEFSPYTIDIIEQMEFKYSSNMMHTDSIHYLQVGERKTNIVELPIHWVLDDAAFWLYNISLVGKAMQPLQAVENYWKTEFDVLYEEFHEKEGLDTCYILTCHPQVIGRPARMRVLENVIEHIKGHNNVEFMTCMQLAEKFRNKEKDF